VRSEGRGFFRDLFLTTAPRSSFSSIVNSWRRQSTATISRTSDPRRERRKTALSRISRQIFRPKRRHHRQGRGQRRARSDELERIYASRSWRLPASSRTRSFIRRIRARFTDRYSVPGNVFLSKAARETGLLVEKQERGSSRFSCFAVTGRRPYGQMRAFFTRVSQYSVRGQDGASNDGTLQILASIGTSWSSYQLPNELTTLLARLRAVAAISSRMPCRRGIATARIERPCRNSR